MLKYTPEMIETEPKQIKEQLIERLAARSTLLEPSDVALVLSGFNFEADLQNQCNEKKDPTLTHPTLTLTSANPSPNQVPRGRHPRAGFGRWLHVRAAPVSNDKPEPGVEPRPLSPALATGPPHRHWGRAGGRGWPGAGGRLTWPRRAARGAGAGGCNFSEEIVVRDTERSGGWRVVLCVGCV